ncbi:Dolichol kinase evan [Thalictrum thalictroides]|uniref:dolichol kinase n=1 Tax=Thalictrum thalictroides TaxID=46969 RepID=A0A7J6WII3_THATH|nr:Dolichol kinase evan [Thalictrum thalictroides]
MELVSVMLNGERTVVILFIARLLYSVPLFLLYEGFALSLLALAGFYLEIFTENSTSLIQFKTRPGASSGILLGTVTLPAVMLSRLIQLSRAVQHSEIGYLILQYWAVSASCFGVLVFLRFTLRQLADGTKSLSIPNVRNAAIGLSYVIFYAAICFFSLATNTPGLHVALKLLWVFCHGMAAVKLILHIIHTFPSCASIGEALLVTAGLVLYVGDMLACTLVKIDVTLFSSKLVSPQYEMKKNEISTIIQGILVGLLIFPILYKFIVRTCGYSTKYLNGEKFVTDEKTPRGVRRSLLFYGSLAVILVLVVPVWMRFVHEFHMHPLIWVFNFVFSEPLRRLPLCIYWIGVTCASVLRFYNISKHSKIERILLRKYYHLVAVLMFSPALILQPKFLDLAFGAALAAFLVLEIIRVWKIWPLGKHIHYFMNAFTDHRDSDLLIVSHFSLLMGCALPKWMSSGFNDRPLAPFAGILSLGIGDTMASMVGHKYGVLRWSKTGKKTIEGTAAGITSVLVACSVLLPLLASTGYVISQHWLSLLFAITVSGLLEAYTAQLDNAFIPLVFYSLLCL